MIVPDETGVLLVGNEVDVAAMVAEFTSIERPSTTSVVSSAADLVALGVSAIGFAQAQQHSEYMRFTPEAMKLIKQYGWPEPGDDGSFLAFVRNSKHIAGQLRLEKVTLDPAQVVSVQTLAVQMALRTAIKEVVQAVEEVGDKVDRIAGLIHAERIGNTLGDRRTLEDLAAHVERHGAITETDWSSVASLGPSIARDIEALREHVRGELARRRRKLARCERVSDVDELLDRDLVPESLALLVIAESNYGLWQRLRIAHVHGHEPRTWKRLWSKPGRHLPATSARIKPCWRRCEPPLPSSLLRRGTTASRRCSRES